MSREGSVAEQIIDKRTTREGKIEFLVRWEGFSIAKSTWEPVETLGKYRKLIKDFEETEEFKKMGKEEKITTNPANYKEMNTTPESHESNNKNENKDQTDDHPIMRDIQDNLPKKIKSVKKINGELFSFVEWEERSDGLTPDPAYVPSIILRQINPKLLIEFYESKIKFVNKK